MTPSPLTTATSWWRHGGTATSSNQQTAGRSRPRLRQWTHLPSVVTPEARPATQRLRDFGCCDTPITATILRQTTIYNPGCSQPLRCRTRLWCPISFHVHVLRVVSKSRVDSLANRALTHLRRFKININSCWCWALYFVFYSSKCKPLR